MRIFLVATFFWAGCQSIYQQCESVKLGETRAQLPFTLAAGNCPTDVYGSVSGPVEELSCCASPRPQTCGVDCTLPEYQGVTWLSSPVARDAANDEWCCVALQNGKVVGSYDAVD